MTSIRRFIPAPAGNTCRQVCLNCSPVRFIPAPAGNTRSTRIIRQQQCGSSPRLRGTPLDRSGIAWDCGSSPRLRGTHLAHIAPVPRRCGSSPRLRGTPCYVSRVSARDPVHPRACGEHPIDAGITRSSIGSSPRLRGTLGHLWRSGTSLMRFIPAPAGNTSVNDCRNRPTSSVHPRACGEHSPRYYASRHNNCRFIPAPAGNTLRSAASADRTRRFIPAPAGNTSRDRVVLPSSNGSSPRLRGTHRWAR